MKFLKIALFVIGLSFFSLTMFHKFYVSVTQVDYVKEKQTVQIITRIFIDDFEKLLRERYDESITLDVKNELKTTDDYIERYLNEKLKIKINNKDVVMAFVGKEYDVDIVKCYLEIENVKKIDVIEIKNQILFDFYREQQNIIKTKINSQQKSFILIPEKPSNLLKFN